jgi:hypothetical protein
MPPPDLKPRSGDYDRIVSHDLTSHVQAGGERTGFAADVLDQGSNQHQGDIGSGHDGRRSSHSFRHGTVLQLGPVLACAERQNPEECARLT